MEYELERIWVVMERKPGCGELDGLIWIACTHILPDPCVINEWLVATVHNSWTGAMQFHSKTKRGLQRLKRLKRTYNSTIGRLWSTKESRTWPRRA